VPPQAACSRCRPSRALLLPNKAVILLGGLARWARKCPRIVRISAAGEVSAETRRRQVDAEVARLQTVGGIHLRTEQDEYDYFAVMADPEGNEFCIN